MLSDVLADAAIALLKGSKWYGSEPYHYRPETHAWVENAARLLAVVAGAVQDANPLPRLPAVAPGADTTFAGPQLEHPFWPLWLNPDELAEAPTSDAPEVDYFGVCPTCHKNDGYLNIGRQHWYVCHEHRVRWCVGSNLFSAWRHETEEQWSENAKRICEYAEVEPYTSPSWNAAADDAHEADACPV